ncbi:MAG: DMT family transporter [Clostridiaceae bacterium]
MGLIFSIIAGICMSIQGVFNTRLSEKIGLTETNVMVQGTGIFLTLLVLLFFRKGDFKKISDTNIFYLLGGVLGVIIIYTVMLGIESLGPTYSIATILIAQLTTAALIDAFGIFGSDIVKFGLSKFIGIGVMVLGIIIFKWKG